MPKRGAQPVGLDLLLIFSDKDKLGERHPDQNPVCGGNPRTLSRIVIESRQCGCG